MPEFKHQRSLTLFLLGCLLAGALGFWRLAERNPAVSYLASHPPAHWIVYPTATDGSGLTAAVMSSEFRREFSLAEDARFDPSNVVLTVRAFKRCRITVNGKTIDAGSQTRENWKDALEFNIAPFWHRGTNEISITVFNDYGPPALWVCIDSGWQEWISDQNWQVSYAGAAWKPARLADAPIRIGKGNALAGGETLRTAFTVVWPHLLLFALLTGIFLWLGRWWLNDHRSQPQWPALFQPDHWPVLAAAGFAIGWAALFAHNAALLAPQTGFDVTSHLQYINYLLKNHRLPLPNEGFEMYQPPLYYLIAATLLRLFHLATNDPNGIVVLRGFAWCCGVVTFTVAFLSARLVFPGQPRKQFFALLLAALVPTNLYIYQYATNELLATTMAAVSVYCCLRILTNPVLSPAQHAWFGLALGGALLTKSSAVVLPPVLFAALIWNIWSRRSSTVPAPGGRREEAESVNSFRDASTLSPRQRPWIPCLGAALFVCIATAGWHYARIAAHFGNPLLGNWDAASGYKWWQQSGYRTWSYYFHFGRSLTDPLFSSFAGFADGVYSTLWGDSLYGGVVELLFRPPWNYDYMVTGTLLALLPTLAIFLGTILWLAGFIRKPESKGFVVLGLASALALLLLYYSFKVPVYDSNKAFYGSAALVPICLLAAEGWHFLCRQTGKFRIVLYLLLGVWGMTTYATYWIWKDAPHTQGLIARSFTDAGRPDLAVARLRESLQEYPHDPQLTVFLLLELLSQGKPADAAALARETLPYADGNSDLHLELSMALAVQGDYEAAIPEARRAIELAPEDYLAGQRLTEWLKAAGRRGEAIDTCRVALGVVPGSGKLHYLLGSMLGDEGDVTNALSQLGLAVQLDPDVVAVGHERMGIILMNANRLEEATSELAEAAGLSPKDASFWCRLAQALVRQGKVEPAMKFYRQSLALNPKYATALGDLAWQLATQPDAKLRNGMEALPLATEAVDLTSRTNVQYLETLSAAYAEARRFDDAIKAANEAVTLAGKNSDKDGTEAGRNLIQDYQAHQPYRQQTNSAQ